MPEYNLFLTPQEKAISDAAIEQHRLRSNAFYQQNAARRGAMAPHNQNHPAFRDQREQLTSSEHGKSLTSERGKSLPSHTRSPQAAMSRLTASLRRRRSVVSHDTADLNPAEPTPSLYPTQHNQDLKLVPDGQDNAHPTVRGMIEDKTELAAYNASEQLDDRTPVYTYSPRPQAVPTDSRDSFLTHKSSVSSDKSPKKRLFPRMNFPRINSKAKENARPVTPAVNVAPKAAAFLGTPLAHSTSRQDASTVRYGTPSNTPSKRGLGLREADLNAQAMLGRIPMDPAAVVARDERTSYPPVTPYNSANKSTRAESGQKLAAPQFSNMDLARSPPERAIALARRHGVSYDKMLPPPPPPDEDTPSEVKQVQQVQSPTPMTKHLVDPKTPSNRGKHPVYDDSPSERLQASTTPPKQAPASVGKALYTPTRIPGTAASRTPKTVVRQAFSMSPIVNNARTPTHRNGTVVCRTPNIVRHVSSAESMMVVYAHDGDDEAARQAGLRELELRAHRRLGLNEEGHLPQTAYLHRSPPGYITRPVFETDIDREDLAPHDPEGDLEKLRLYANRHSSPNVDSTQTGVALTTEGNTAVFQDARQLENAARHRRAASDDTHELPARGSYNHGVDRVPSPFLTQPGIDSSNSSSLGFLTDLDKYMLKDPEKTTRKLSKLLFRKPNFSAEQTRKSAFTSASAVPSPLQVQQETWNDDASSAACDESVYEEDHDVAGPPQNNSTENTSAARTGRTLRHTSLTNSDGSESLRDRYNQDAAQADARYEAKLDELLKLIIAMRDTNRQQNATNEQRLDNIAKTCTSFVSRIQHLADRVDAKDLILDRHISNLQFNEAKTVQNLTTHGRIINKTQATVQVMVEELGFMDDWSNDTNKKIETIEFAAVRLDGTAKNVMTAMDALNEKVDRMMVKVEALEAALPTGLSAVADM